MLLPSRLTPNILSPKRSWPKPSVENWARYTLRTSKRSRVEARAHEDTVRAASRIGGWLDRERAPLATPDARWDRLLYPIHDVETYLKARAPRDLLSAPGSRLPKTGT